MSGGHFEYRNYLLDELADEVERLIAQNGREENDGGYKWKRPEYDQDTLDKFRLTAETLRKGSKMLKRVDWLASGDDGEETFKRRWEEEINEETLDI
jgi:hypothetical protein